jgi:hypothetical protein
LIFQAWALSVVEYRVGARPERHYLFDYLKEVSKLAAKCVWAEISRAIVTSLSNKLDTGPLSILIHPKGEIRPIIFQSDIITGLILRDEVPLE